MLRRHVSSSPPPRAHKRAKLDHLTKEDFKNGVFLAPMVRSGALPTRLFALKHGATLVWGPEIVDKAILHSKRVVNPVTGVISYDGVSRAIFSTHPIEKPYLIYQIGSADPDLAVQAAKTVVQDVSGIDLNCGCPKSFSTHSGMGAALLTNPDLLCSILTALRKELPPHITVTAKIRLLPSQEDTLNLVERIVNTGISALTIHCRTRSMRDKDRALIERLREIVTFVERMGKGIAVIENGDTKDWAHAKGVREITGAHSVMIARGAEANPSCFSLNPLKDVETTLVPAYLRLSQYLETHWSLTKFCVNQFKSPRLDVTKAESHALRVALSQAKNYSAVQEIMGISSGQEEFQQILDTLEANPPREHRMIIDTSSIVDADEENTLRTPVGTQNPEPPSSGAPFRATHSQAENYSAFQGIMGISSGQEEFQQFPDNPPREQHRMIIETSSIVDADEENNLITPVGTQNPEPPGSGAPLRATHLRAKNYSAFREIMGISSGQEEFQHIPDNPPREHGMITEASSIVDADEENNTITPVGTQNPEPPGSGAPFLPNDMNENFLLNIPGHDAVTPTPTEAFPAHIWTQFL